MPSLILIVTGDAIDAKALQDALGKARDGPFVVEWLTQMADALTFRHISSPVIDVVLRSLVIMSFHKSKNRLIVRFFLVTFKLRHYQKRRAPKSHSTRLAMRSSAPTCRAMSTT